MGLCVPQKGLFPVFAGISRVWKLRSGPKFHRLSVSWPYSCVKSLKKVGHSSLEIWASVTPKKAPFLCLRGFLEFGSLDLAQTFHRLSVSWPYSCVKSLKKMGHSSLEIWAFVTPKKAPFPVFAGISRVRKLTIWPKISPIVRLLAIQLCEKFEESGTFESGDMGLCVPQKGPFPVFAGISRVRKLTYGPKFHRLSVSWPYSCVKSLKKVGHSSLEIWASVSPKKASFLCLQGYLEFGSLDLAQNFTDCPSPGHTVV